MEWCCLCAVAAYAVGHHLGNAVGARNESSGDVRDLSRGSPKRRSSMLGASQAQQESASRANQDMPIGGLWENFNRVIRV